MGKGKTKALLGYPCNPCNQWLNSTQTVVYKKFLSMVAGIAHIRYFDKLSLINQVAAAKPFNLASSKRPSSRASANFWGCFSRLGVVSSLILVPGPKNV